MKILNLGCGTKTSDKAGVVNIDLSILLRIKGNVFLSNFAEDVSDQLPVSDPGTPYLPEP